MRHLSTALLENGSVNSPKLRTCLLKHGIRFNALSPRQQCLDRNTERVPSIVGFASSAGRRPSTKPPPRRARRCRGCTPAPTGSSCRPRPRRENRNAGRRRWPDAKRCRGKNARLPRLPTMKRGSDQRYKQIYLTQFYDQGKEHRLVGVTRQDHRGLEMILPNPNVHVLVPHCG